jgi:ribosomal protein L37AE/L43A
MTSFCKLCDKETTDNYIGGVWVCSVCYPKFKEVFEAYIPFVDMDKLQALILQKQRDMMLI